MDQVVVQKAEETEQQVIAACCAVARVDQWEIGRLASLWCKQWAAGRTDADFVAQCVAHDAGFAVSADQIKWYRRVYDVFGGRESDPGHFLQSLSWSHYRAAVAWDDAEKCLSWAAETGASRREMEAYRATIHGKPAPTPEPEPKPAQKGRASRSPDPEPDPDPAPNPPTTQKHRPETRKAVDRGAAEPAKSDRPATVLDVMEALRAALNPLKRSRNELPDETRTQMARELRRAADSVDPALAEIPESLDDDRFRDAWSTWIADRKSRGKAMTLRAQKLQLEECESWGVSASVAAIMTSIKKGWTGLFADRATERQDAGINKQAKGRF